MRDNPFLMHGSWSLIIRRAIEEGTMSINPLYFQAAARLDLAISENLLFPNWTRTMVIRVDNASSFDCINAGRSLSKIMRLALHIFVEVRLSQRVQVIAQHVRT